jgi:hypothetical protein
VRKIGFMKITITVVSGIACPSCTMGILCEPHAVAIIIARHSPHVGFRNGERRSISAPLERWGQAGWALV